MQKPILEMRGISKNFGAVAALKNIDFDLYKGEVHGLVGENGAGKSTLMKIVSGAISDYEGKIYIEEEKVHFNSPWDAKQKGIGMIYQELSLIDVLTVAENISLGNQPVIKYAKTIDWREMKQIAKARLQELGFGDIDVNKRVGYYTFGVKQIIEITKTLGSGADIIIMDEPTSGISRKEIEILFQLIEKLKKDNKSIVFISHYLEDVLEVSDRITVLRDGGKINTLDSYHCNKKRLVEEILGEARKDLELSGKDLKVQLKSSEAMGELPVVLKVENLGLKKKFKDISFELHKGEVLGLYGFVGSGHLEVGKSIFGDSPVDSGKVLISGREITVDSPIKAKAVGIGYVPEDRSQALVQSAVIHKNITLPYLARLFANFVLKFVLRRKKEIAASEDIIRRLRIKAPNATVPTRSLSGGNMQKVSVGRWLTFVPEIFVLAEPTHGIDVGAKVEIFDIIRELKDEGESGIIVISSEPEVVMEVCDRILVFFKGEMRAMMEGVEVSRADLLERAI